MKLNKKQKQALGIFVSSLALLILLSTVVYTGFGRGDSMTPTINQLSWIVGNRLDDSYKKGDVVVAKPVNWNQESVVKRILAVPGDKVVIDGAKIYVNNLEVKTNITSTSFKGYSYQSFVLEDGEYFIVGDNFMNSYDSRARGPVKAKDIKAKVIFWINF